MSNYSLSIIILTYNEEKNLPGCLSSLKAVKANLFVVDSYSTDKTLDILEERNIEYVQHSFENYAKQRNWAQENCPFDTPWVFHIDAGERITPELSQWLNTHFSHNENIDGYMFSRRTIFFGKWIRRGGHYPNYHLRLYKKNKGHCEDKVYDQHFVVEGKTQTVNAGIDIIDTVADNLKDFTQSHSKWAYFEAIEILSKSTEKGEVQPKLLGSSPIERRRWLKNNLFQKTPLFVRSFLYFFYRYFLKLGFLDGKVGLVFHLLQGFWFRFLVDATILELKIKITHNQCTLEELIRAEYDNELLKAIAKT